MRSLLQLRKVVFRDRSIPFHWNLNSIVDLSSINSNNEIIGQDSSNINDDFTAAASASTQYSYEIGSFVAVNTGNDKGSQDFSLRKVVEVIRGKSRKIIGLSLHWYQFYGSANIYLAKYKPEFLLNDDGIKDRPWIDRLTTDTVLVSFRKLTS